MINCFFFLKKLNYIRNADICIFEYFLKFQLFWKLPQLPISVSQIFLTNMANVWISIKLEVKCSIEVRVKFPAMPKNLSFLR